MAVISYASISFVSPLISKSQFCSSFPVGVGSVRKNRSVKFCKVSAAAVVFPRLDADDFRHPLHKQNTVLLRAIPGLNDIRKAFLGTDFDLSIEAHVVGELNKHSNKGILNLW
ncbi:hypothetical protein POM88_046282 [Heracleum sosnowskyi]|uniref:Uncharacterized protein n=1 Tax=Heracleum sosnowskyi TaxID=360622 RepID=A0AAD8H889_9APIA|nr:hypothetical protein POM88_046282 [Heracleum sosnowskyi]